MKSPRSSELIAMLVLAIGAAHAQSAEIAASVINEQGQPVADAVVVAVPADGAAVTAWAACRCPSAEAARV